MIVRRWISKVALFVFVLLPCGSHVMADETGAPQTLELSVQMAKRDYAAEAEKKGSAPEERYPQFLKRMKQMRRAEGGVDASAKADRAGVSSEQVVTVVLSSSDIPIEYVINQDMAFATVDALKAYLRTQPVGTILRWDPGCIRVFDIPLLDDSEKLADFRAFCASVGIDFVLVPSG